MPIIHVHRVINVFFWTVVIISIFTPIFVPYWNAFYEQEAKGAVRFSMHVLENAWKYHEKVSLMIFWPFPRLYAVLTNLSLGGRAIVTFIVHAMVGLAAYDWFLRLNDPDVEWEFRAHPVVPHRPRVFVACVVCGSVYSIYLDMNGVPINTGGICFICRTPLPRPPRHVHFN